MERGGSGMDLVSPSVKIIDLLVELIRRSIELLGVGDNLLGLFSQPELARGGRLGSLRP
jgi:hypothetical protein